ncbi:DNA polymerase [Nitrosospira sp. Nsp18]|uniref:uracil-DNA glycosylase n=1 Tax=Nitrosospira sp. Nsp18 TaxID=1855334 RepID=UPI000886C84C|nr:uracil-DNA glycosylase [Nitrosospira sp. Nsp18]SDA10502.1 DNA polymerase [Nitrosospira sp. Nsp18]
MTVARRTRRKDILKELGLTPLWRTRTEMHGRASAEKAEVAVEPVPDLHVDAKEDRRAQILRMGWDELKASVEGCIACPLFQSRTRTVFGIGDKNADWLYVGEGPGAQEDATGEPFVGQAGKLLDNMLAAIDLKRGQNVYIANIVKCRPPDNRAPTSHEAHQCEPYLARQIELMKPRLIIALGKVAAENLLHTDANLGSLRGRLHQHSGIPVIVTYHPAYLLRTLPAKAKAWEDLCFARRTMETLGTSE